MNEDAANVTAVPTVEVMTAFLLPVLVLVIWTLIMWIWMYATRIPAFQKAGITPDQARHPGSYSDKIPSDVRAVADNYNHLHEQPTIFYAVMAFAALTGGADAALAWMAWTYVGLRIAHSLIQCLTSNVGLRFGVFALGSLTLMVIAGREVMRLFM